MQHTCNLYYSSFLATLCAPRYHRYCKPISVPNAQLSAMGARKPATSLMSAVNILPENWSH